MLLEGRRAVAITNHTSTSQEELSYVKGDTFYVLDRGVENTGKWWVVESVTQQKPPAPPVRLKAPEEAAEREKAHRGSPPVSQSHLPSGRRGNMGERAGLFY